MSLDLVMGDSVFASGIGIDVPNVPEQHAVVYEINRQLSAATDAIFNADLVPGMTEY
ncbi:hypothetical protein AB7B76_06285 [Klebsiella pneumoniae]